MSMQKIFAVIVFLFLVGTSIAFAHSVGISRGTYHLREQIVNTDLVFARPEIISTLPMIDSNRDGDLSAMEAQASHALLQNEIVNRIRVSAGGARCQGVITHVSLTEQDGIVIDASYHCGQSANQIDIDLEFLSRFSYGHRHLFAATAGNGALHGVAYQGNSTFHLNRAAAAAGGESIAVVLPLFRLGILHILTGYDHLVFLLGLILVGGRVRSLITVITAFTAAHTITLCVAALGVWTPSPAIVEPAIALSIAYIGFENWFVKNAERRWMITFPFGLIHGFGFAGALREISIPHSQIPLALGAFNIGVEFGQLCFLLAVLPIVTLLRRQGWFVPAGVRFASATIVVAGCWWFVHRVF